MCSMERNSCNYSSSLLSSPKKFSVMPDALPAEHPLTLPVLILPARVQFRLRLSLCYCLASARSILSAFSSRPISR